MISQEFSGPLALVILDGWGHRVDHHDNGIELAQKPFFDSLIQNYPNTLIDGSGPAVGLPKGIMGNSEVGHMNLGAGRVVYSGLSQIYQAIADKSFFSNPKLVAAADFAKNHNGTWHLMGLLSDGAVHSHQDHLDALLDLAKTRGVKKVAVHAFLDGRDTAPQDGVKYLQRLQNAFFEKGVGYLASVSGRYFAMDRDKRWDRVAKAFAAICGKASSIKDPLAYVQESYRKNIGDEFVEPASVMGGDGKTTTISKNDALTFFNFRADRAREISHAFVDKNFSDFDRAQQELPGVFVAMTPYDSALGVPVAFTPQYPNRVLGEIVSDAGLKQLRIAETEKYAHVTFFFNGGRDLVFQNEDRCLVPSPKEVPTYDHKPEMSAFGVRDELVKRLDSGYQLIVCNFANADMVGHTAIPEAILSAVHAVDDCLSTVIPEILKRDGVVIVTADHGNAEEMKDAEGKPMTAHTTNLVPLILCSEKFKSQKLKSGGRLCDVAPTILALLGLEQPKEMTGTNLLSN